MVLILFLTQLRLLVAVVEEMEITLVTLVVVAVLVVAALLLPQVEQAQVVKVTLVVLVVRLVELFLVVVEVVQAKRETHLVKVMAVTERHQVFLVLSSLMLVEVEVDITQQGQTLLVEQVEAVRVEQHQLLVQPI
jgi:hypothetical protein